MEARDYIQALMDLGLNQVAIARRSEVPQSTISKVMRGEVTDVLSRNYRKLQALHAEVLAERAVSGAPVLVVNPAAQSDRGDAADALGEQPEDRPASEPLKWPEKRADELDTPAAREAA